MYRLLILALFSVLFVLGCSSDDDSANGPSCEDVQASDPAGQACGDDGCPSVECVCNDGSSTNLSSCFNGVCVGAAACAETCSSSDGWVCENQSANNQNNQNNTGGMFDCAGNTCDAATQYCLTSVTSGGVQATAECVDLPAGCSSCECAGDDAPNQFPTSNNCDSLIACGSSNGQISVECTIPQSF